MGREERIEGAGVSFYKFVGLNSQKPSRKHLTALKLIKEAVQGQIA